MALYLDVILQPRGLSVEPDFCVFRVGFLGLLGLPRSEAWEVEGGVMDLLLLVLRFWDLMGWPGSRTAMGHVASLLVVLGLQGVDICGWGLGRTLPFGLPTPSLREKFIH